MILVSSIECDNEKKNHKRTLLKKLLFI